MTIWILKYSLFFLILSAFNLYIYFKAHDKNYRKYGSPILLSSVLLFFVGLAIGLFNNEGYLTFLESSGSYIKIVAFCTMIISTILLVTLTPFFWWRSHTLSKVKDKSIAQRPSSPSRRLFLKKFGKSVPVVAAATALSGSTSASSGARVRKQDYHFQDLHPDLVNFNIVQFSDVHLGTFISPQHIKDAVKSLNGIQVDLVVLTGDIADDFELLDESLEYLKSINPKYGIFASIGNHEIFRGREQAVKIWERHGIHYLCNTGEQIQVGTAKLFIAGLDDPGRLFGSLNTFLEKSAKKAFAASEQETHFKLTLSHRPEGFDAAHPHASNLTLSGHTHGAQVAYMNKSLFSFLMPKRYLLGRYQKDNAYLYTSAGLGHWFPLRFGCPCEINVHTLLQSL